MHGCHFTYVLSVLTSFSDLCYIVGNTICLVFLKTFLVTTSATFVMPKNYWNICFTNFIDNRLSHSVR